MNPIWTLEARDSVALEMISSYFNLSDAQMRRTIIEAHEQVQELLTQKGIDYRSLRSALTPQRQRIETAYIFDTARIDSGWYGYDVAARILPHLDRNSNCSILVGDLILEDQDLGFDLLERHLRLHKACEIAHTSQLYSVYINNLSDRMAKTIHDGLLPYEAYVGYIPVTFSSRMKDWLSATLVNQYIKRKVVFLCGQEDDVENDENYNLPGWPIEDLGYKYASRSRCISTSF
jgi:hypothetical protein